MCGRPPPAFGVGRGASCYELGNTPGTQRTVHRCSTFPLFELDHSQSVANPRVDVSEHARCFGQAVVRSPPDEIAAQLLRHRGMAPPSVPAGHVPDAFLHRPKGLGCHAPSDRLSLVPETVAQECPAFWSRHRTLRLVDSQPEPRIETRERLHHVRARPLRSDIDVQIICVTDEGDSAFLQLLVHFVEEHVGQQR